MLIAAFLVFAPSRLLSGPQRLLRRIAPGWVDLATPLLPCGPLYLMLGICTLTGSAARGASLALVFGLGTIRADCGIHGRNEFVYQKDIEDLALVISRFITT